MKKQQNKYVRKRRAEAIRRRRARKIKIENRDRVKEMVRKQKESDVLRILHETKS